MEELSIKVKICDRTYPMKVSATEEARIRKIGKLIDEQVRGYKEKFGIYDQQDLLAMVVFDCLVTTLPSDNTTNIDSQALIDKINALTRSIEELVS